MSRSSSTEPPPAAQAPAAQTTKVIVNPRAGGGRAGRRWPSLRQQLETLVGAFSFAITDHPGHATALTRRALRGPYTRIVAVGGDGTLNEVVNGFFEAGHPLRPEALLVPITCGTGGDFRRSLGVPDAEVGTPSALARDRSRVIDVGTLTYTDDDGTSTTRHFINIASFGMGGAVDQTVQRVPFRPVLGGTALGGPLSYLYAIVLALIRYRNQPVELQIDGASKGIFTIRNVAVANGRYFGGGLQIAPHAALDDGVFDVVVLGDLSRTDLLRHARRFYEGTHEQLDAVTTFRGRSITAIPHTSSPVLLDVDGEPLGHLPATFEIVPRALRIQY